MAISKFLPSPAAGDVAAASGLPSPAAGAGKSISPKTPLPGESDLLRGQHWRELVQENLEVFLSAETPEDEELIFYRKEKLVGSARGIVFSDHLPSKARKRMRKFISPQDPKLCLPTIEGFSYAPT